MRRLNPERELDGSALCRYRAGGALLVIALACWSWGAQPLLAQQWRGRGFTRFQFVEARPLRLDSVPVGLVPGSGNQRFLGDTLVTCAPGASHCFFRRPGSKLSTAPVVQDLELTLWGFGIEGLRVYTSTRLRAAMGDDEFWPRDDDNFDLLAGYVELDRQRFRVRLGRDYQVSGLGFYGYDGGSFMLRLPPARIELEAYGGWGLARALPEPVNGDALESLEEFQPRDRNLLFGFRGSAHPLPGSSFEAIYQREIETDRSGIASERIGLEATYAPAPDVWLRGHADYDLAAGWWGKAGLTTGWTAAPWLRVEGRLFRYRPVFSLQTIWVAFSPVSYTGWGGAIGLQPFPELSIRVEGERRDYADTEAEVPFQVTTDRTWRAGVSGRWDVSQAWSVEGGYRLNFTVGSSLSAGDFRAGWRPRPDLSLGARFSAFQQLGEFRVGEGRVWSLGADARWRSEFGTLFGSIDRYDHDRRGDGIAGLDWTQTRASLGLAFYLGSEPGRTP